MTTKLYVLTLVGGIALAGVAYVLTDSVALASIALMVGLFGGSTATTLTSHTGEKSPWTAIGLQGVFYVLFAGYFGWTYLGELEERSPVLTSADELVLADLRQDSPAAERLTEWLDAQIGQRGFPALGVAVADRGGLLYEHVAGDPETQAAGATALFPVASVSKAFTGVLMLRMAQEGLIDPHQPISAYLPDGTEVTTDPSAKEAITPWMLATHSSGLPRSVDVVLRDQSWSYSPMDVDAFYGRLAEAALQFEPGDGYTYSNLGYGLLGHVLSRSGGDTYQALLRKHVLAPLNLNDTTFLDYDTPSVAERLVTPHRGGVGSTTEPDTDLSERLVSSGGLATTAADMARLGAAVLAQPSPLLDAEHQAMLLGQDTEPDTRSTPFGSVRMSNRLGRLIRKNGGRIGADAYLLLSPEHGLAISVVTNRHVYDFEGSSGHVAQILLERMVTNQKP